MVHTIHTFGLMGGVGHTHDFRPGEEVFFPLGERYVHDEADHSPYVREYMKDADLFDSMTSLGDNILWFRPEQFKPIALILEKDGSGEIASFLVEVLSDEYPPVRLRVTVFYDPASFIRYKIDYDDSR